MQEHFSNLIVFIAELRKSLRFAAISLFALTAVIFCLSTGLIGVFQEHLDEKLYFFSVAEPFLAHIKAAFFGAIYCLMPLFMHILWKALGKPFDVTGKKLFAFTAATCLLFYVGTVFCAFVTLPYGASFLLGFQSEHLKPYIAIGSFVNFVTILVLAFGVIFELPVFMVFSAQIGALSHRFYEKNRRFAVLAIAILSAMLTPTPDVVNMALMGLPLYLLYEAGILVIRLLRIDEKQAVAKTQ
ncbi:MAG: sec-independent protein translocase protein TatC [Candidatus Electronema aureum]|uniref:Sec-independent protein translocase protein TatC n=1 Tax=Candidatus Electronema aureum TaxID=2005002 RepID=A0A521G4Y5_9BACT|nr:MAG: sec-independent protein translocase protein TatC [Candidatus Electronema aureum]